MDDLVQGIAACGRGEGQTAQLAAVEDAVWRYYAGAEMLDQLLFDRGRLDHLVPDAIGVDQIGTPIREELGQGGFPRPYAAGYSYYHLDARRPTVGAMAEAAYAEPGNKEPASTCRLSDT